MAGMAAIRQQVNFEMLKLPLKSALLWAKSAENDVLLDCSNFETKIPRQVQDSSYFKSDDEQEVHS